MKFLKQLCRFLGIGLCFSIGAVLLTCLFFKAGGGRRYDRCRILYLQCDNFVYRISDHTCDNKYEQIAILDRYLFMFCCLDCTNAYLGTF